MMAHHANDTFRKTHPMPTRNVVLTDQQADMIERLVHSDRDRHVPVEE